MLETSAEIGHISVALAAAQGAFPRIIKDTSNPFFKSKYAPLASIIEGTRKALAENKIAVIQGVEFADGMCSVTTMLAHESGQWMRGTITMPVPKLDPQGVGSASTYARRYGLSAFINVAADDDDDGNAATGNDVKKKDEPKKKELTEKEVTDLAAVMQASTTLEELKDAYKAAVTMATRIGDTQALTGFSAVKDQQKLKLEGK